MYTIIQFEILKHIRTYTFSVLTLMSMGLFLIGAYSIGKSIQKDIARYETESGGTLAHPSATYPWRNIPFTGLAKPYNLLSFMAEGDNSHYPKGYWIYSDKRLKPEYHQESNYKLSYSPKIDWAFIVQTIFVLYIILLSHDSISGEKESGSLRLILSNPISRLSYLFAKTLSMLTIALLPLLIGMISGLLLLTSLVPSLNYGDVLIAALFFLVLSITLLTAFLMLSILLSSLIMNSSISLLAILAVWITMFVIPEISPTLAKRLVAFAGESHLQEEVHNSEDKWTSIQNDFQKAVKSGTYHSIEEVTEAGKSLCNDRYAHVLQIEKTYFDYLYRRQAVTKQIARISLLGMYQNSVEKIVNSGEAGHESFLKEVNAFANSYALYVAQKTGKTTPINKHAFNDSNMSMFGLFTEYEGKPVMISWGEEAKEGTEDLSDFPKFSYTGPSIAERVKSFLFAFSGLLLWNLALAFGAFLAFNRADVR